MVCIDPAHGGIDGGAVAGGVREKHLALIYGLSLGGELCRLGVPAVYTRTTDEMPGGGDVSAGLLHRVKVANDADADAFVSVHFNASVQPEAAGLWLIHAAGAPGGQVFAEALQKTLGGKVVPDASGWTGDRRLLVLRRTRMPAVLIEYGFLTNVAERARLLNVEHMRALIARTAEGIIRWMA